jgi:hypothetical protein
MNTAKLLPVALLIAAGLFIAPGAFAQERTISARFAYNSADSAQEIYSSLKRTARRACQFAGVRSLNVQKYEWQCVKQMLDEGVAKIGRADIAALHHGNFASADTRG